MADVSAASYHRSRGLNHRRVKALVDEIESVCGYLQEVHPVVFVYYFLLLSVITQQLSRSHSSYQCKMSLLVVFYYIVRLPEPSSGNIY
jgi:hypothetical protein